MRPIAILLLLASVFALSAAAQTVPAKHDLPEIKASGQLRHLGIPYALSLIHISEPTRPY